jgi:hypothetical protein
MTYTPASETRAPVRLAPVLFTTTIFLSASLLFFVQPLFAKIVLPVIGGAPSVWTTAMLFFQIVLLAGYLYAHFSTRLLAPRAQVALHLAIWAAALLFLPPAIPEGWQLDPSAPVALQTLGLFALGVGVPFALLSANAPLLQSWYARSGGPSAHDPYFLYGASNLGSLLALMAFPLLAEPLFGASDIAWGFAAGFVALGAGLAGSGALVLGRSVAVSDTATQDTATPGIPAILRWGLLAFVPSSLMLAVTSKISTDIGAVPLVWVIPLALYLLSFVLAFRSRTPFTGLWFTQAAQLTAVAALCLFIGVAGANLSAMAAGFLILCFFTLAIWAHRALYEARPPARHLTMFYVTMSVGGAAGGLFNSLIGPAAFNDHIEGIVTLIAALGLVFAGVLKLDARSLRQGLLRGGPLGLALAAAVAAFGTSTTVLAAAVAAGLALLALTRPSVPVLAVAASLVISLPTWLAGPDDRLLADRSFFGLHQVLDRDGVRLYTNGTTVHGAERLADLGAKRPVPTTYYHPDGPLGQVMRSATGQAANRIGIVGLGVGSLACYAHEGQHWHFYEIDAMVDRVARDPSLFTFLSACAPDAPTHLGDARVVLERQQDIRFDVLVIDAYSSNAVPLHLTTVEAMELYMNRLAPGGVLLFHISNRYYDIGLPLARSAEALGLSAWRQNHDEVTDEAGFRASDVAMIARTPEDAAEILRSSLWSPLLSDAGPVWTDDKADPLSILKPGALR